MNPLFQNNQGQRQERSPPARPTFFRKNNNRANEERNRSAKKQEKPGQNTGIFWKMKGNESYQKGNYEQAIAYYNKAVVITY